MIAVITITLCRDCIHWEGPNEREYEFGLDDFPDFGTCPLMETELGKPVFDESLAHAQDGDNRLGKLYTKPDFGCVMGEPRQPESPQDVSQGALP